jgi:hypothetical protein
MQSSTDQDIQRYLGIHRVIEPQGALPQPAWKLDNTPMALPTETFINVQKLHIDSASFTQIAHACGRDTERMKRHIMDIIAVRGKMHNPVTGSGGVLIGTVEQLDESSWENSFGTCNSSTRFTPRANNHCWTDLTEPTSQLA